MERTMKGSMSMAFFREQTGQQFGQRLRHKWKNETEAQSRKINATLGQALLDASNGPMFGNEFNVGADKDAGTLEMHFSAHGEYDDGDDAFSIEGLRWHDLDTVDVVECVKLFEALK
jgi:hypothetical protein